MSGTGQDTPAFALLGRGRECAPIDELLAGAAAGESGVLVIRGEAGIGKTALLDRAEAGAAGCGVRPWQARAESELRATGERPRGRDPSTIDELTPQELLIAGLVATGLTNRQNAASSISAPVRSITTCTRCS